MSRARSFFARVRASAAFAIVVCGVASALSVSIAEAGSRLTAKWSADERALLQSLTLESLGPLPHDPSNRYADDPHAESLGKKFFFDKRFSSNGAVSCATCHLPERGFQDDTPLAHGVGTTARRTMPIAGTAYGAWFFWDGRADSQWAQALGPLESPVEHGGNRVQYAKLIEKSYRGEYEAVFGALRVGPAEDVARIYANIGKAIAAYERRILPLPSRFDRFVAAELTNKPHTPESAFTADEEAGLRIFIGKGSCTNCHNGALLSDDHFHNTGVAMAATRDSGRTVGVRQALAGEFNCTSRYSDANPDDCQELKFATTEGEELLRAFKTPSLRNVADRAPYMHAGQIASLRDVVAHYSAAPASPMGHSELKRLELSRKEQRQLEAFLRTLSGGTTRP
jgi:cytochrome c peroxidase